MSMQNPDVAAPKRWPYLAAAFLAMAVVSPYEYAWSSISPLVSSAHGWSAASVGLIFTLFIVFQSGASFPTGVLRDRFGPRALTVVGGVLSGLGLVALASGSLTMAVIGFGIVGSFGVGIIYSNCINTGNKWFPDKRGLAAGLIAGAFSWGSIPFVIWIRSAATPTTYPSILLVIAGIVTAVIVGSGLVMRDPAKGWLPAASLGQQPRTTVGPASAAAGARAFTVREALATWQFWVIYAAFVLISSAGLMTIAKIVSFASATGYTALVGTAAAAGLAVTNGLGRPVIGKLADRLGYEITMTLSFTLAGVFLFVMLAAPGPVLFVGAALVALFFWGPLFSLFPALAGHRYGSKNGAAIYGVLYSAKMVGGLWGGWASAVMLERFGFQITFAIGAVMAIASGALVLIVRRHPPS